MDLFETTLKVVENRTTEQENLSLFKQNLEDYIHYITQLKDILQETQQQCSSNTEILEINNYTKNSFNENSKQVKELFGLIYEYVQQIEENLSTISQRESALRDLSHENEERLQRVELTYNNFLKEIEIMKKDVHETYLTQSHKIQKDMLALNSKIKEMDEKWDHVMDQQEQSRKHLELLKMEVKILEDNIETELQQQEKLVQQTTKDVEKYLHNVNKDLEINNKIIKTEESILEISEKLKEKTTIKHEAEQKRNQLKQYVDNLIQTCYNFEIEKNKVENENKKIVDDIIKETEQKQALIAEKENQLSVTQSKSTEALKEIEEIATKLAKLDEELIELQNSFDHEEVDFVNNNKLEKIMEEQENLILCSEKLLKVLSEKENEIQQKREQLDTLKTAEKNKISELEETMKSLEIESKRKRLEAEKEIEEIEYRNKILQHNVDDSHIMIKGLNIEKQKLEEEREKNQTQLKELMLKCDDIEKELKRIESAKQNIKSFATPNLKPVRSVPQTRQPKKRSFSVDLESDSSADGERLSYAEFMAKKKMMKENKKQKK